MNVVRINNRNNFLIKEIPTYHPKSLKYIQWWRLEKSRCIQGLWSIDDSEIKIDLYKVDSEIQEIKSNKWRYMTPNLFFYVNFGIILHRPSDAPKTAPKKRIKPHLRDIEWEFFYNWIEARGFSGFADDDEYSCNRDLLKFEQGNTKFVKEYNNAKKRGNAEKDLKEEVHNIIYDNSDKVNTKITEVKKEIKEIEQQSEIENDSDSIIEQPQDEYEEFRKQLESDSNSDSNSDSGIITAKKFDHY